MTLPEFKAWFEGYTEDLEGAPSAKQWARIKKQVGKIDGTPITRTVFVDHYRHYLNYPWFGGYVSNTLTAAGIPYNGVGNVAFATSSIAQETIDAQWDGAAAMYAVGKADALAA